MNSLHKVLNDFRKRDYFFVAIVLFTIYFLIVISFDYLHLNETMFWAPDSLTYRAVGNWIFGIENTEKTISRPFFYPLMLNLSRSFGGIYGIWIYQFLIWLLSGILLYHSIKKATNNIKLSIIGILIFSSNLTLMFLTLHALTEVTVTFLLTLLIYVYCIKKSYKVTHFWFLIIFIISLLTVTKPVYIYLLYSVLLYRIIVLILNFTKSRYKLILVIYTVLSLSPVIVQFSIMKVKHNEFIISKIGFYTAQDYYLPNVYSEVNNVNIDEARKHVSSFNGNEMVKYLITHYKASIYTYFKDIVENFLKGSGFTDLPHKQTLLTTYMKIINKVYFLIHVLMILPCIIVLRSLVKKRDWDNLEIVLFLVVVFIIIIFSSGVTFGQGDRILLPSLPIWITLYSLVLYLHHHLKKVV